MNSVTYSGVFLLQIAPFLQKTVSFRFSLWFNTAIAD